MSLIQAVIFDLDGVLVDGERYWEQARAEQVAAWGGAWNDDDQRTVMGYSSLEWARHIKRRFAVALSEEQIIDAVVARMLSLYEGDLPMMPGAVAVVETLAARYPIAVASAAAAPVLRFVLETAGIADKFTAIVSADEVANGKPAPDVYLEAARRIAIDPARALVFEDSSNGIRAAHAAGMRVIALPNQHYPPPPEVLSLAVRVLPSFTAFTLDMLAG